MVKDPTIEAHHIRSDVAVSDLANREWNRADAVRIDHYWSGEVAPSHRHAQVRLLWSDKALHIRYVCNQAEPLVVTDQPQIEKKTMNLWDRDVCEVFIAPDPQVPERYFEFEVAPTGEWLDAAIDLNTGTRETNWEFRSHMTTAAKIEKKRVTMAMRIPWGDEIHRPHAGEHWRVNLFRCVGKDPDRGYLSWQPTLTPEPLFHVPRSFGLLIFK